VLSRSQREIGLQNGSFRKTLARSHNIFVRSHFRIVTMAPNMESSEHENFFLQLHPSDDKLSIVKKPSNRNKKASKRSEDKKEKQRRRRKDSQTRPSDIALSPRVSPQHRAISFAPSIRFKPVKHIDDFTVEEIEDIWFTEYDLNVIRADCIATVRHMIYNKDPMDEETYCTRGLEFKTPAGAKFRKDNKQTAIQAVMAEQRLQKSTDLVDEECLSKVYRASAGKSRHISHLMALRDEHEQQDKPTKEMKPTYFIPRKAPSRPNPVAPIAA
jgi:hypothetical protein